MREVDRAPARHEGVDIVAADAAQDARKGRLDFTLLATAEGQEFHDERVFSAAAARIQRCHFTELARMAVREKGMNALDVVSHGAVTNGPSAAGIVAGHAADGGPGGRRYIDGKPEPMRP